MKTTAVDNLSQRDIMQVLAGLSETYKVAGEGFAAACPDGPIQHIAAQVGKGFYGNVTPAAGSAYTGARPDLAETLWADAHRLARSIGESLLKDVDKASRRQPENGELALVARVAGDMHKAIHDAYRAGKNVENRVKLGWRSEFGMEQEDANRAWQENKAEELGNDATLKEAHAVLRDVLLPDDSLEESEEARAERLGTLVADYAEAFPDADEGKVADAVALGERVAVYNFMSTYGYMVLSDEYLQHSLRDFLRFGKNAGFDVAELYDTLNGSPYDMADGLKEADIRKHMTGHSRQVKLYAVVEELLDAKTGMASAVSDLAAIGLDEDMEIRTGKEMAALMGGLAHRFDNGQWMEAAGKVVEARTGDELQDVLRSGEVRAALDGIAAIEADREDTVGTARELVQDARGRADKLDVRLPSAVRQYHAQRADACPMHR